MSETPSITIILSKMPWPRGPLNPRRVEACLLPSLLHPQPTAGYLQAPSDEPLR